MATIQNDRDVLLQAAAVRVVPVTIAISDVVGLPEAIAKAEKSLEITASAPYFSVSTGGFTTPSTITLTAVRKNGLSGTVTWSVESGSATLTPSGGLNNTCSISGPTVSGTSVIILASVTDSGRTYTSRTIVGKYGALSTQNEVDLATQITGQLANGNVSGLGALALLGNVNLATTQVVGDLAASRIGVGTLAAGVIYAGTINADKVNSGSFSGKDFTGGTFTGGLFRTATSGRRIELNNPSTGPDTVRGYDTSGSVSFEFNANQFSGSEIKARSYANPTLTLTQFGGGGSGSSVAPVLRLESLNESAHLQLNPVSSFPSGAASFGQLIMHSTHGLCGYNGSAWVKFTVTAI